MRRPTRRPRIRVPTCRSIGSGPCSVTDFLMGVKLRQVVGGVETHASLCNNHSGIAEPRRENAPKHLSEGTTRRFSARSCPTRDRVLAAYRLESVVANPESLSR